MASERFKLDWLDLGAILRMVILAAVTALLTYASGQLPVFEESGNAIMVIVFTSIISLLKVAQKFFTDTRPTKEEADTLTSSIRGR